MLNQRVQNLKTVMGKSANSLANGSHSDINKKTTLSPSTKAANGGQCRDSTRGALSGRKGLCSVHELPPYFHEPFILSGYRAAGGISQRQCLTTMFSVHNETVNVWSHLLGSVLFAVYFCCKFHAMELGVNDPQGYPLVCFAFGICLVFLSSALAHLFSCISLRYRHICFYLDYAAISIFTFTAGQAFYFYSRPSNETLTILDSPYIYLGISATLSIITTILSCLSRHYLRQYRFLLRTGPNVIKFFYDTWPFVARICQCSLAADCNAAAINLFYRHWLCYAISGVTYAAKIPERWIPGVFDFFGHSHHFLHIVTIFGNYYAFSAVSLDMEKRARFLADFPQPTFFSTFGLLMFVVVVSLLVVLAFIRCLDEKPSQNGVFVKGTHYRVIYSKEEDNEKKIS